MTKIPGNGEHDHQAALFHWLVVEPRLAKYRRWSEAERRWVFPAFSVPNARKISMAGMLYYKAEGLQPGVPDVVIAVPRSTEQGSAFYGGLFIEMKSPARRNRKDALQDNQVEWLALLAEMGYKTVVCYSVDEAKTAVEQYLGI
jgi:hypothetical protein